MFSWTYIFSSSTYFHFINICIKSVALKYPYCTGDKNCTVYISIKTFRIIYESVSWIHTRPRRLQRLIMNADSLRWVISRVQWFVLWISTSWQLHSSPRRPEIKLNRLLTTTDHNWLSSSFTKQTINFS